MFGSTHGKAGLAPQIETARVYHAVPTGLTGDTLYPLNQLKSIYPDIFRDQVEKYVGREGLLAERIPGLDCLWNDVLQFSPVHPAKVRDGFLAEGYTWTPRAWFEVDPVLCGMTAENTSIYHHPIKAKGDFRNLPEEFEPFSASVLSNLGDLPERTLSMWRTMREEGQSPLLFIGVPHILFKGAIPLASIGTIEV